MEVSSNATLEFSYIGYMTQLQPVGGKNEINVNLKEDTQKLDEVVVVGYGTQTKREITGSITNVTAEDFNQGLTRNAADLLQGKVAGLTINTGSGDVTGNSTIQLRGLSTLQNDQGPLIVIDNVPGMDMSTVNPQDIESISILKDASSAAIYGSRSAGGVILITTKKGYASKPTIAYNGAFGVSTLANKPNLLTADQWRSYTSSTRVRTVRILTWERTRIGSTRSRESVSNRIMPCLYQEVVHTITIEVPFLICNVKVSHAITP